MAFNNLNNPRQMFPTQNPANFSGMQASGHPVQGFQPNHPYGTQGFSPQQTQRFPGYQRGPPMGPQMGQPMGHQMNPQMGPQMRPQMGPHMQAQMRPQMAPQANSQMGLQIGAFPANIQLGHQFPKQQQKIMEQQRKRAEEQLKKQEELIKKKQLEAEKRKLQQSFSAKKPTNANALNNLFGMGKKSGGSSMTDLIGSLGSETSTKPATSKPSTFFSRPGGSAAYQSNLTPSQWGSGYMTPHGGSATTPSKQFHDEDDFGDFSQGPSVSDQGDFSGFQGAQPSTQFGGGSFPVMGSSPAAVLPDVSGSTSVFSQSQSWQGTPSGPTPFSLIGTRHSFSLTQSTPTASSIHGPQRQDHMTSSGVASIASSMGSSSVTQGGQMTHFSGDTIRPQTGSTPGMPMQGGQMTHPIGDSYSPQTGSMLVLPSQFGQMTQFPGNAPTPQTDNMHGMSMQRGQMTHFMGDTPKPRASSTSEMMPNFSGNAPSGGTMPQPGSTHTHFMRTLGGGNVPVGAQPPTIGPQQSGFGLGPSYPSTVPVLPREEPNTQQGSNRSSSSAVAPEPTQEPVVEVEDSPERKLELLYGVTLPDWCVNGTDLPGVYKEIAEKTTDASDAIDTNRLFPILMASDLPRDQLGQIWNKANRAVPGQLNTLELRIILGLVALAQAGLKTERLTLEKLASCKAAPIPTIPEHVLQTRGRGWSFTEPSQEGPQSSGMSEGFIPRGRLSSTSSDHSIDPNDKYSVFRAVEQPDVDAMASSPSVDSKDRFGAFHSGDIPMSQPSQLPLLHSGVSQSSSGWNQTEVSSIGGSNVSSQQQNFGHFQTVTGQGMNEQDEFGDFRGQTVFGNNCGPSKLGQNVSQDDFGDFQSETTLPENTTSVVNQTPNQVKVPDVRNFQAGGDWGSGASSAFKASNIAGITPQKDDFGDFQGGNEPETGHFTPSLVKEPNKQEQEQEPLKGFGNFQIGDRSDKKTKSSESAGLDLFSKAVNNTTSSSAENVDTSSLRGADDFGDFQHSPGPLSTTKGFASFGSSGSEKLASSLEKFKLSNNALSSSQGGLTPPSLTGNKGLAKSSTNEKQPTDTNKENVFGELSGSGNILAPPPSNQAKASEDKYSALRDADWGSGGGLFTVREPVTTDDQLPDDGFADFGGFEVADQFKSEDDDDFGAFKSTENVQSVSFGVAGDSQSAQQSFDPDFGDFSSSVSMNLSTPQPKTDSNGGFGAFGSFATTPSALSSNQPHPSSNACGSLINAVSLEPTERYKVLSHDSGNMDQHAHAWSRCLNSCLLTLATATLAIQKIGQQSVKEEVLESKEGATYFSAIVEIYRVTLRIKASISKTAPNNTKLKDIQQEIERTWKDISNFLTGSDILPSRSSLDFTLHRVSGSEDGSVACGICLLNVNKNTSASSKNGDGKLMYGGRHYHSTCANFWCNRVDSVLPSLLLIDSLI